MVHCAIVARLRTTRFTFLRGRSGLPITTKKDSSNRLLFTTSMPLCDVRLPRRGRFPLPIAQTPQLGKQTAPPIWTPQTRSVGGHAPVNRMASAATRLGIFFVADGMWLVLVGTQSHMMLGSDRELDGWERERMGTK